jgi:hypothetical protein
VRHRHPRAKRSSALGCLGRLSGGPWARGFILRVFLGSFAFVFYKGKRVFPDCLGEPYGCPRHTVCPSAMSHGRSSLVLLNVETEVYFH